MPNYIKRFKNNSHETIRQEARFQRKASELGVSPRVIRCNQNSIVMENLNEPCIADKYGKDIDDIPEWIKKEIVNILFLLYSANIEYIDVTPYNFIEKDDRVWIIDFGHARVPDGEINWYLDDVFNKGYLEKWNEDFE